MSSSLVLFAKFLSKWQSSHIPFPGILLSLYNYLQKDDFLVECQLNSKDVSLPKDCNY